MEAPPPTVLALSSAALKGPRGGCGERTSQTHFRARLPRSFPPPEPPYPSFPASLLSPPSGCPSLGLKVASSLPPRCSRILPADHPQRPSPILPGPWSTALGLPPRGEALREAQTGRGAGVEAGRQQAWWARALTWVVLRELRPTGCESVPWRGVSSGALGAGGPPI